MKKLYRVTVQFEMELVVLADDEEDAEDVALTSADEASADAFDAWQVFGVREIKAPKDIPPDWADGLPWGRGGDDRTVEEILACPVRPECPGCGAFQKGPSSGCWRCGGAMPEPPPVKDVWTAEMFPKKET